MRLELLLRLLVLCGSLMGCAPSGETTSISPFPSAKATVPALTEIIPGAQQAEVTDLGYKAFSAVGESIVGGVQTTTKGYKVYSSVQVNIGTQ